jgi:hypothetical protein
VLALTVHYMHETVCLLDEKTVGSVLGEFFNTMLNVFNSQINSKLDSNCGYCTYDHGTITRNACELFGMQNNSFNR